MRSDRGFGVRWHAGALNNGMIFGATYHGVTRLPRRCSYGIGHVGTWLAYRLMRRGTAALIENLRVVQPGAPERELRRIALLTYRSYARDTIDFIRGLSMDRAQAVSILVRLEGDFFDGLLGDGRGILMVCGHFGNWELGGLVVRLLRGYPITVVGRPEPSAMVGVLRRRMREAFGIETIEIGHMLDTALKIRGVLARNHIVATLVDRHLGRDRIDVTFFGRRTAFLRSPAMIAHLSGAPMLPAFMIRQADGRFVASCGTPIRAEASASTEENILRMTQAFADELERRIRAHPHLWYQFYPYWSP